jgi:dihydrofolate reductase
MRDVVLIMTASLDGYVVAPSGHAGGMPEPEELKRWKLERIRRAGTHMMGRVTYQEMASFWPTSTDDYAAPMNDIPKVVFSKTLTTAPWPESTIARGGLAGEVTSLKEQSGGEIYPQVVVGDGFTFGRLEIECVPPLPPPADVLAASSSVPPVTP